MVVIERVSDLPAEIEGALVSESESAGLGFVRRLVDEWASGRNRFDQPGAAPFVDTLRLRTENPSAARLYERMGFRRSVGLGDCRHIMALS